MNYMYKSIQNINCIKRLYSTITNTQIIANINQPICKDCVYYFEETKSSIKCLKFANKNLVSGIIEYDYAETNRKDKCGNNGKYFRKSDE